ncbi:hypothetical protein [Methanobrevibacter arboriphilus]|nr:hypothetical protein [Methanobrevibacter arboriphilus]
MNPITFPIITTIIVIGAIAIILVKLLYKDKKTSDLSDDLPPIVNKHWKDPFTENNLEEESNEYSFVSKSWEEPMQEKKELKNGVASKIFQEPMHIKHQDIISNDYYQNHEQDIEISLNQNIDLEEENLYNLNTPENLNTETNEIENNENIDLEENEDGSFRIIKKEPDLVNDDTITPYTTPEEYNPVKNNLNSNLNIDNQYNNDYIDNNNYNDKKYKNYSDYGDEEYEKEYQKEYEKEYENYNNHDNLKYSDSHNDDEKSSYTEGLFDMGEKILIGGNYYDIKVGDEIIFNYNGESYSSKILEIKHENIRVKYRAQEKWISFSDVKKIF